MDIQQLNKVRGIGSKTIQRIREQVAEEDGYKYGFEENLKLEENTVNHGDCLKLMNGIEDDSVDMILCDPPYGTTKCKWDSIIPLNPMWLQVKRVLKKTGVALFTATQPFTANLIMSNVNMFKYCWVWDKKTGRGHLVAKKRPMAQHEDIVVFGYGSSNYFPIMEKRDRPVKGKEGRRTSIMGGETEGFEKSYTHKYPKTILSFKPVHHSRSIHPTQKPVKLLSYLIKTYTCEGDIVFDFASGSGSTAIAAKKTDRRYICIEKDKGYYRESLARIASSS